MNIKLSVDHWPEYGNAVRWGAIIDTHPTTIFRAERLGKLERGFYVNKRVKLFSKVQILKWLQIPYEEPKPKTKSRLLLSKKG
jgi:hypothetical protein